jgi:8-oxo-dGTP pyrophosphatase MutT (NUDIX family)
MPTDVAMRKRPSARLLLLDGEDRVLLFQSTFVVGPDAGRRYWYVPGGALEAGESYEQAAIRELREETGVRMDNVGVEIGRREFILTLIDGERVAAEERFFTVRADPGAVSFDDWADSERDHLQDHRWWPAADLEGTTEVVFPEKIGDLLAVALGTGKRREGSS